MTKIEAKLVEARTNTRRNILSRMWGVRIIFKIACENELYKTSFKIALISSSLWLVLNDFVGRLHGTDFHGYLRR